MQRLLKFCNRFTGEVITVVNHNTRLQRLDRRVRAWRNAAHPLLFSYAYCIWVDLTYAPDHHWQPYHITEFMRRVRRFLGSLLLGYVWVAEMQQRGAPHYHVLLVLRSPKHIPFPDLVGWWPWGMTKTGRARSPFRYLTDYVRKAYQKANFPKGMRIFAVVWDEKQLPIAHWLLRLSRLPQWLLDQVGGWLLWKMSVMPKRVKGGWWFVWPNGWYRSPWVFCGFIEPREPTPADPASEPSPLSAHPA